MNIRNILNYFVVYCEAYSELLKIYRDEMSLRRRIFVGIIIIREINVRGEANSSQNICSQ